MPRGRPRTHDRDETLEKALQVFWQRGYHATSMNDLVEATGVAKPGLYADFGDKDHLFVTAVEHYLKTYGRQSVAGLEVELDARAAIEDYLLRVVDMVKVRGRPPGCFMVNSVSECATLDKDVARRIRAMRSEGRKTVRARLLRARDEGHLSADQDIDDLTEFIYGQTVAIANMARTGTDKATLIRFVHSAMAAWPED
jgi:AcrR family transcriptional regulator